VQFRFEAFALDTETRQLLHGGRPLDLSPKAFELIRMLVEARPRALSKSDLHERLWPDTFVADANLPILVAEVRRALKDDARSPRFVRTLHGFGYAFSAAAVEVSRPPRPAPNAASYWLIWRNRKFLLAEGDNLIGRSPEAAVWLDLAGVSREHARITIDQLTATLIDLGSRNGTFRGGVRITTPAALSDGDDIQLGPVLLKFRIWQPGAGSETEEVVHPAPSDDPDTSRS